MKPERKRSLGRSRSKCESNSNRIECRGADWIQLAQNNGPMSGCCEHGNVPSVSIEVEQVVDQLSDCQFIKKDSVGLNFEDSDA
jgi:hypothetical protein